MCGLLRCQSSYRIMAGGGQALHAGQGRDMVDDYLDFTEGNAEALSTDPSRIFVLALSANFFAFAFSRFFS